MNDEPGWMVLRVHDNERKVLGRALDAGVVAFLPEIWAGAGKERVARPLYPRYVFARHEPSWARLNRIDGVSYILGGEEPGIVPHAFVRQLRTTMDLHGGAIMPEYVDTPTRYRRGQVLRIVSGPAAGLFGTYEKAVRGSVDLLLDFMGGSRAISVPAHMVAPAL